jgi:hypothetical protein
MANSFDYSKWDNIELSDDEEDVHPNIDKESWFRMKHRSRVDREEKEEVDKKRINDGIASANLRTREVQKLLDEIEKSNADDADSDDDDLEDKDGLLAELDELKKVNKALNDKLEEYERNKKWNVDNMCHVVDEKTIITKDAATPKFSEETGYALPSEDLAKDDDDDDDEDLKVEEVPQSNVAANMENDMGKVDLNGAVNTGSTAKSATKKEAPKPNAATTAAKPSAKPKAKAGPMLPVGPGPNIAKDSLAISMMTYPSFVEKYEDILEAFMAIGPFDKSKDYLLLHGDELLQENASSYLLLACLEDEMNGLHDKMRLVGRQSQMLTNIAELAKTLKQHPGNVILPFFKRMEQREHLNGFLEGVNVFIEKVKARAIVKKKEIDAERATEEAYEEGVPTEELPKEERLGPGGLDPVEVFETLPVSLQEAFESRGQFMLTEMICFNSISHGL